MNRLNDHWRRESFDALRQITDLIANGSHADLYAHYLKYLELRHQGRRKEALAAADRFVAAYKDDPFEIRHRVCWSLIEWTENQWHSWPAMDDWLFPGNIGLKLMNPMFEEWRQREPRNVNAWLYPLGYGLEWGAETAFMLEPKNPRCQYAQLAQLLPHIAYGIHELDHIGYVLFSASVFSEMVKSLTVVTSALGDSLCDEAHEVLAWLNALANLRAETEGDLRPELAARGIVEPTSSLLYQKKLWFREPPKLWGC